MKQQLMILLLCCAFNLSSQEKSLKIYNQFIIYSIYTPSINFTERVPLKYNGPSIAYRTVNDKRLKQISFRPVFDMQNQGQSKYVNFGADLKFDLAKELENYNEKLNIFWGGSTWLGFLQEDSEYSLINSFPVLRRQSALSCALFANVEYHFSKNLYVELAANFFSFTFNWMYQEKENPILLERQRIQSFFDLEMFGQRNLQLGIGYVFAR